MRYNTSFYSWQTLEKVILTPACSWHSLQQETSASLHFVLDKCKVFEQTKTGFDCSYVMEILDNSSPDAQHLSIVKCHGN